MFDNGLQWNEQSYWEPPIDVSYQVSVYLAKQFQRRRFFKIGQSETRIACGGHVCWQIRNKCNRNYSAILATLQITLYALGV